MTRTDIDALSGAELDAAVAEEVMGWKPYKRLQDGVWEYVVPHEQTCGLTGTVVRTEHDFVPHTSWADAMEVVAKLIAAEWCFGLSWIPSDEVWEATFDREKRGADKHHKWPMETHCVEAPHGPTAICRAALLARAGEER